MKQKNKLTPRQREEIIELRFEQGMPIAKLAERYNVTAANISYYIKKHKLKMQNKPKTKPVKTLEQTLDPIQFRIAKLEEVSQDIETARQEKIIHSLPTFHKLHINIHNELRELVLTSKDVQNLDSESLKREIVETIAGLPPILRTQIIQELEDVNEPNVIRLKTQ